MPESGSTNNCGQLKHQFQAPELALKPILVVEKERMGANLATGPEQAPAQARWKRANNV